MRGGTVARSPRSRPIRLRKNGLCDQLQAGQVGYLICNIKTLNLVHIGDTVTSDKDDVNRCPDTKSQNEWSTVASIHPTDRTLLNCVRHWNACRLTIPVSNSSRKRARHWALVFAADFWVCCTWKSFSNVWNRKSDIDLVQTAPNVTYEITTKRGEFLEIHRPQEVPDAGEIEEFRQPIVRVNFILPTECIGPAMRLCQDRRGIQKSTEYLSPTRAMLTYDLPLAEVIYDLHDKLKSATRGYGTMDYELIGYHPADLVRLDILVNGNRVDALSVICDRADAERRGRAVVKKLKTEINRHMFEVAVQAAIGARVIARETVPALRKNVTAKCYGGDITRKRKLWAKQREGKKRMKSIGQVDIPQKAFMAVLDTGDKN